jgi:hypothetical protein
LYKITIYRRVKEEQICFTTPEAATAINSYLESRRSAGEKLTDDSPLFRKDYDKKRMERIKYARPLTADGISFEIRQLAIAAGLDQNQPLTESVRRGQRRKKIPSVHGFRKFTITQMARAKVDTEVARILTGHSIGVRGVYLKYSEEDLLSEYAKSIDLLTINEANRLKVKVNELVTKNASNEYMINQRLQERESEVKRLQQKHEQDMRVMREEMNQQFNQIMSMIQQNPKLAQIKPEVLPNKKMIPPSC